MMERSWATTQAIAQAPEGSTVFEITPKTIRRTRLGRKFIWYLGWGTFAFLMISPLVFNVLRVQGSEDILRFYAAFALPAAVLALGNWFLIRKGVLAVNRVAICEKGLYPPRKPKARRVREDLFIPYKDIVSMEPVAEKKGFIPAYNMILRDGLKCQMNSLDLLLYVREAEVRRYEKMLRVIKQELSKPENRAKAARDEDILIPQEKFGAIVAR